MWAPLWAHKPRKKSSKFETFRRGKRWSHGYGHNYGRNEENNKNKTPNNLTTSNYKQDYLKNH
jgi:hypothetical protein